MTGRRRFRGWFVLWAVLQLALPTMATYADALLERGGLDAFAHVESGTGSACAPVHPGECAICHSVHRSAVPSEQSSLPEIAIAVPAPSASLELPTLAGDHGRLFRSRAPPRRVIG